MLRGANETLILGQHSMTKMSNDFGPLFKGRAAYHQRAVPGQLLHGLSVSRFVFDCISWGLGGAGD